MDILKFALVVLLIALAMILGFRSFIQKEVNSGSFSAPTQSQQPSQVEAFP